jgi:hypothetical protein
MSATQKDSARTLNLKEDPVRPAYNSRDMSGYFESKADAARESPPYAPARPSQPYPPKYNVNKRKKKERLYAMSRTRTLERAKRKPDGREATTRRSGWLCVLLHDMGSNVKKWEYLQNILPSRDR